MLASPIEHATEHSAHRDIGGAQPRRWTGTNAIPPSLSREAVVEWPVIGTAASGRPSDRAVIVSRLSVGTGHAGSRRSVRGEAVRCADGSSGLRVS